MHREMAANEQGQKRKGQVSALHAVGRRERYSFVEGHHRYVSMCMLLEGGGVWCGIGVVVFAFCRSCSRPSRKTFVEGHHWYVAERMRGEEGKGDCR